MLKKSANPEWIALVLGNSRSHYAHFERGRIKQTWHVSPLTPQQAKEQIPLLETLPLYIASVVPEQTRLWQGVPLTHFIELRDIPLKNLYSTLGIDRALALLGLLDNYGNSGLVIDAGTAITLTGVKQDFHFVGGAILPGLKLQFESLAQKTGALPLVELPSSLPKRWTNNTTEAIQSGVLYTILAGLQETIEQWQKEFPDSSIVFTGGDGKYIFKLLGEKTVCNLVYEENLLFLGFRSLLSGRK